MINKSTPPFRGVFKQKRREVFVPLPAKLGYSCMQAQKLSKLYV